ncbi:hypothetical protein HYX70_00750 [Candidatus Saccharibacteria bacterium]|nr:hypothetical protein [Candidatus Saccharibacteria bacterium]
MQNESPAPLPNSEAPESEKHTDLSVNSPKSSQAKYKRMRLVAMVLGGVCFVLLILVAVFATRASVNDATIQAAVKKGEAQGRDAQKAEDDKNYALQQNKDTRVYKAPDAYGAYELSLPKYFSLSLTPGTNGALSSLADPDVVDVKAAQHALRMDIQTTTYDQVKKNYDSLVKDKRNGITAEEVTVSGIKGIKYTGIIDKSNNNSVAGTVVLLPVRDKTYILRTDNNEKYQAVYQQILDQIKINP